MYFIAINSNGDYFIFSLLSSILSSKSSEKYPVYLGRTYFDKHRPLSDHINNRSSCQKLDCTEHSFLDLPGNCLVERTGTQSARSCRRKFESRHLPNASFPSLSEIFRQRELLCYKVYKNFLTCNMCRSLLLFIVDNS